MTDTTDREAGAAAGFRARLVRLSEDNAKAAKRFADPDEHDYSQAALFEERAQVYAQVALMLRESKQPIEHASVDAEALLEKLRACFTASFAPVEVDSVKALALLTDALGPRAMTEMQALTACKHGKPTCGECLAEAPLELLRLNPFARHDIENKPPTDPARAFIFGIRYYAGMLEDGDSWGHSLGHIQECCKEFAVATAERAGRPPPEEEWESAFARVYKGMAVTDSERMAFSCGWAAKAE